MNFETLGINDVVVSLVTAPGDSPAPFDDVTMLLLLRIIDTTWSKKGQTSSKLRPEFKREDERKKREGFRRMEG